jgi:hypothetical protein
MMVLGKIRNLIMKKTSIFVLLFAFVLAGCVAVPANNSGNNTNTGGNTSTGGSNNGMGDSGTNTGGSTVDQRGFVVQLIASNSPDKAESIKNQYFADGYNAFVNDDLAQGYGQPLYRVQIGPYMSKSEAENVLAQMRSRYPYDDLVKQGIVNENY